MMNDEYRPMPIDRVMGEEPKRKRDLRVRTKAFALAIVRLYVSLPKTTEAQVLGRQMLRSGTSPGAHYREATRARSTAEFVSKIEGALQELEETVYWVELLIEAGIIDEKGRQCLASRGRRIDIVAFVVGQDRESS